MTLSGANTVQWMRPQGLILGQSRGPLEATYLPLQDPMTVLYGLNGAGKSYVLDALRDSLSGVASDRLRGATTFLVATVPEDPELWSMGLTSAFESITGDPMMAHEWQEGLEEQLSLAWGRMWRNGYHDEFLMKDDLAGEFARSRTFLVRPAGRETPSWELRPLVIPSMGTPATSAFLRRLRDLDDEDAVTLAPVYELWRDTRQPPDAPTILYSESFAFTATSSADSSWLMWGDVIVEGTDEDIDQVTASAIQRHLQGQDGLEVLNRLSETLGVATQVAGDVNRDSLVGDIQARANCYYATMLRDAPALELELRPPTEWLTRTAVRWVAKRFRAEQAVPVGWLSHAERRWAILAIRLALSRSSAPLMVLDEPEAALHRTAEAHMAAALASLASESQASILVSTHSPELLDSRGATRVLVRRRTQEQPGALVPFTGAVLEAMEDLGLQPADLLRRTRAFLLVEGEHDVAVLMGWFATELAALGVDILPLRGGSKLRTVLDSRFLFDYTDALLFPFLDDMDVERVQELWTNATRSIKTARASDVIDTLRGELRRMPSKGTEYIDAFLTRALQLGREARVFPLGVRRADILDYLPVTEIVPTASSWEALRAELKAAKRGVEPTETEFKDWLRRSYKADLSPEALAAVASNSRPAEEITHLMDQVRDALQSEFV